MGRLLNLTLSFFKRCGIKRAIRFLIYRTVYGGSRRIEAALSELLPKHIEYVYNIHVIQTYISVHSKKIPIYVSPFDSGLSKDILLYHIREPVHSTVLYNTVEEYGINRVLDIGSNIGYFPLIERSAGSKYITAIEPVPDAFSYLSLNLRSCGGCNMINAAVGVEKGSMKIYTPLDRNKNPLLNLSTVSKVEAEKYGNVKEEEVKTIPFKELIEKKHDMVRVDIEGYEWNLFSSVDIIPDSISAIDFEVHAGDIKKVKQTLQTLYNSGFREAILVNNPSVPTFVVKLLGINLFNRMLSTTNNPVYCGEYPFKDPVNTVKTSYLLNNPDVFLSFVGDVQVIFLRSY